VTRAGNLLRRAKALIADPKDWTQEGVYMTDDGCMCAAGALNSAYTLTELDDFTVDTAYRCIKTCLKKVYPYALIGTYNDDPKTTHSDIMNLFDDAAAMADER
jgi:hypothetical protein